MTMVDLHIHSTSSDGIHKPVELVAMAKAAGITAIAIADHDSTDGLDEALIAATAAGIDLIPAVELSVAYEKYHDVHLLGYFIDYHDRQFREKLQIFQERRADRGLRVIENINRKLAAEGKQPLESAEILALAEGSLGRPHIARVLVDKRLAATMQDAFNAYLVPCNVPKEYFPFDEALAEIHRIGGVAVLAHPQSISRDRGELYGIIAAMAAKGLDGIEAYNTMGAEGDDSFLKRLASTLDLVITGGSDFHGGEEGLTMGRGRGNLQLTVELLQGVRARRTRNSTSPAV